jgi:hypothetical protein
MMMEPIIETELVVMENVINKMIESEESNLPNSNYNGYGISDKKG